MKYGLKSLIYIIIFMIFIVFVGCTTNDNAQDSIIVTIPDELQTIKDKTKSLATGYALQLDGEWADEYVKCLKSEEGRDYAGYANLKASLDQFRIECGAYRVYILTDMNIDDQNYEITVDGSINPKEWMDQYIIQDRFISAQSGEPTVSRYAENSEDGNPIWSASAPVYDSSGQVIGILNIEYPATEVIKYPEWNQDSALWQEIPSES